MKIFKLAIVFYLLGFSLTGHCKSSADDIIKELRNKYNSITDFSADLLYAKKLSGKIYFRKPSDVRIEQSGMIIISNGKTSWNYNRKQNQVVLSTVKDKSLSPDYYLFNLPENTNAQAEKDGQYTKLTLIPKNDKVSYKSMTFWIDENYLINKVMVKDLSDNTVNFELKNIKVNKGLDKSLFEFKNPAGAKVIDLR